MGGESIVRITQFTYSLINEFPIKRITIGDVVFLMPGTPEIANKAAPEVLNVSSPGFQPGDYGGQTKNLETMDEINGWIGIERIIPSDQKTQMMMLACI